MIGPRTDGQIPVRTTIGDVSLREARELQAILGNLGVVALRRLLKGRFERAMMLLRQPETDPRRVDYERGALDALQEVDTVLCELDALIAHARQQSGDGGTDDEGGTRDGPGSGGDGGGRGPE